MGIAVLMIILCHAPAYGVEMPSIIKKTLVYGNLGVDIFLFLSGIGCYYSLAKDPPLGVWYKKRFNRIFVPYTIIQIPLVLYHICKGNFNLIEFLYEFSTLRFWTEHVGAWYVALLIPLYIVTPILYSVVVKFRHRTIYAMAIITGIILICSIEPYSVIKNNESIIYNILVATKRCVSFCLGLYIGPMVANGQKINLSIPTGILATVYIMGHAFLKKIFVEWCLVVPVCFVFIVFLNRFRTQHFCFITWMGIVSLESYLANIYLKDIIKEFAQHTPQYAILQGGYLEYGMIIVFGLILSFLVNQTARKITQVNVKPDRIL